ncbi:MAG: TetR/AcrR family transcriptional regulator [Caulobacterales bacterium]|nr:TetR/AcrR family transcriptional regulator [Caulobacterales bacterium]
MRQERLQKTREAILQSALDHFAVYGFEGASIRAIAAKAGVNHGMIRHIYGGKDELWRQAVVYLFERARAELTQDFDRKGLTDREAFIRGMRRYVHYCARHPEHARMMIQQSIIAGPKLTWAAEELIRARHTVYLPLYERLKASGDLPDVDTSSLIFIISAACQMTYVLAPEVQALTGRDPFAPEAVERHVDAVVKIFLR